MNRPLGLYVHIPFCARRCPYCDFAVQPNASAALMRDYVVALARELQNTLTGTETLASIFFGGGTPTALPATELAELLGLIRKRSVWADGIEISIEANPEHLDEPMLRTLRESGWNRLSLGAQSFDDDVLKRLGRRHDGAQIERAFRAARAAGFDNVSLDLIFAVPGQRRESWRQTLQRAAELEPEHVSCYALTIEAGTAFDRLVSRGQLLPVVDDEQAAFMEDAVELLAESGIERYEVSNWARAGRECRHNLNYWRGGDYLACGVGAHGHRRGHRWWNERDTTTYIAQMGQGGTPRAGEEFLTPRERWDERVMLGLRLREGLKMNIAAQDVEYWPGEASQRALQAEVARLKQGGFVWQDGDALRLRDEALAVADGVAARLAGCE